jgi:peptide-methionine (S)-S-oxide reductase
MSAGWSRRLAVVAGTLIVALALAGCGPMNLSAQSGSDLTPSVPLPIVDAPPPATDAEGDRTQAGATSPDGAASEVAVLAGGCFWGVQGVFQHVAGVTSAVSGYTGGAAETAHYELVSSGTTGHAESVQITFDPHRISYGRLLQIYFAVAHDPTQLDRQGPDFGSQYRSAIFPTSEEQARVARAYIDQLGRSAIFSAPIVTRVESDKTFYPAEDYHQDYLTSHPMDPYIVINDLPKIDRLKRTELDVFRADPVLVGSSTSH